MANTEGMIEVYEEFGIDIHSIPANLQAQFNALVREVIKLRKKRERMRLGEQQKNCLAYIGALGWAGTGDILKQGFRKRVIVSLHHRELIEKAHAPGKWRLAERDDWRALLHGERR